MGGLWSQAEKRDEGRRDPGVAADNSRKHQQWQINLLDHIDAVQDEVSHRMDFIERELDGKSCGGLDLFTKIFSSAGQGKLLLKG